MADLLDDDLGSSDSEDEDYIPDEQTLKEIEEEKQKAQEVEKAKETSLDNDEKKKKHEDDVWASFLADVGQEEKREETVTVAKKYEFAGETVVVRKEVTVGSNEAKDEMPLEELLKTEDDKAESKNNEDVEKIETSEGDEVVQINLPSGVGAASRLGKFLGSGEKSGGGTSGLGKRKLGGLDSVLDKIGGKTTKISTLDKTKLDWDTFKSKEGLTEELREHCHSKNSYLERQAFLERSDWRQFEKERDARELERKRQQNQS